MRPTHIEKYEVKKQSIIRKIICLIALLPSFLRLLLQTFTRGTDFEMSDNVKGDNASIHGTDWEVVSLTASAYAAAPSPNPFNPNSENKKELVEDEHAASAELFMSGHFTFPPSDKYKNILLEPGCNEIQKEVEYHGEEDYVAIKSDTVDSLKLKSDLFDDVKAFEEEDLYSNPSIGAFSAKTNISEPDPYEETADRVEANAKLSDYLDGTKEDEDSDYEELVPPCETWWKKHAISLYNYAKESNKFWSVFVAAAVMGFVILGHKWQREKMQLQQIKWYAFSDESLRRMLSPVSRLKHILVGGNPQNYLLRGAVSNHASI